MSDTFTFPPPPPPPPPKANQPLSGQQSSHPRGGFRGRGGSSAQHHAGRGRGQGRGFQSNRGQTRGSYAPRHVHIPAAQGTVSLQAKSSPPNHDLKRDHTTAFRPQSDQAVRSSRPKAPPAVPSYGVDLDALLPTKPPPGSRPGANTTSTKQTNLLGLTPAYQDSGSEEEEDDNDDGEEARLAAIAAGGDLTFEYNGRTATLTTAEEIAAWIAERRKKWPTEAKRDVAQREAAEKRKKWEVEKAARMEASKAAAKAKQEERTKQKLDREKSLLRQRMLRDHIQKAKFGDTTDTTPTAAQEKTERLRKKAEKIAAKLKIAEDALSAREKKEQSSLESGADLDLLLAQIDSAASAQTMTAEQNITTDASDSDLDSTADDETSSSGSSMDDDPGSDSAPEESSSRRIGPDRTLPPAKKPNSTSSVPGDDRRPLCRNFSESGRCKYGKRCHYRHEKPAKPFVSTAGHRRKGLFQIMVEKEQEEERKRTLQAIVTLGDAGLLQDKPVNEGHSIPAV